MKRERPRDFLRVRVKRVEKIGRASTVTTAVTCVCDPILVFSGTMCILLDRPSSHFCPTTPACPQCVVFRFLPSAISSVTFLFVNLGILPFGRRIPLVICTVRPLCCTREVLSAPHRFLFSPTSCIDPSPSLSRRPSHPF